MAMTSPDGLHRGTEHTSGSGELLSKAQRGIFGDDVVSITGFERRWRDPGDVVWGSSSRGVADGQLGRDLGDGETRWPSRREPIERLTRGFISMMTTRPGLGLYGKLDVGSTGFPPRPDAGRRRHRL